MKKILILDDDQAVLEVMESALTYSDANFMVKTIESSTDIFTEIKQFHPDLILTDYLLQGVNGGKICHEIKSKPETRHIPVVMISAYSEVLESPEIYGCDAMLSKPFDLGKLLQTVNALLPQNT